MFGLWHSEKMNEVYPENSTTHTGGLFIGDWQGAKDIKNLKAHGIKFVLTALPDSIAKNEDYEANGITQFIVPSDDMPSFDMSPFFDRAYKFIDECITND